MSSSDEPLAAQVLADLSWVLGSPSLVEDPLALGPVSFDRHAVDTEHLAAFIAERQEHRVGRYFEHLLHYWLRHVRQVEMVGVGVQVTDGNNRTLGEIDFLYRNEHGALCHCEAAVKFFLHYPNPEGSHFPGPAARDNFERKSTQLFDKQLELSKTHVPETEVWEGFVRGRVFTRIGVPSLRALPHRLSPGRLGGRWVRESELELLDELGDVGFHFVQKPHWFAPCIDAEIVDRAAFRRGLAAHFDGPAYPVMVSARDGSGDEVERCFVVPDAWPAGD